MGKSFFPQLYAISSCCLNWTDAYPPCDILPYLTDRLANRSQHAYNE